MLKVVVAALSVVSLLSACQSEQKKEAKAQSEKSGTNIALAKAGLSEKDVTDAYVYLMSRYFVIRQERLDVAEKNLGYNKIKYIPTGQTSAPNPNLDSTNVEAWIAVDEKTCQILNIPKIKGRYYTAQVMDEWAGIIANINERTLPQHPNGKFAFCLKEGPPTAKDMVRINLPSNKAKLVARIEGQDAEAVRLQKLFKLTRNTETDVEPAQKIPMFANENLLQVEAFEYPIVETVLRSAPDSMKAAQDLQAKVRAVAQYASQSDVNKKQIDTLIEEKSVPQFRRFVADIGVKNNGWSSTAPYKDGFGEDYWFRTATTFGTIWWNEAKEVVYFKAEKDRDDRVMNGTNTYLVHFDKGALPKDVSGGFWSLTILGVPDSKVVTNAYKRYQLNSKSNLTYGRDGSLTLVVGDQPRINIPRTNWIPGPREKLFSMNLKIYAPKESVLNGTWTAPSIVQIEGLDIQKTSQR
ncbi:DUF1214 domain-containing protein [Bdellovibrio sp. NC01]|uniref:DUF1214 domain-containing protein n=1 Tax=Bdellovibrio sp. NC01 TaxID=2220073 RepID=UPI00115A9A7C|nr:DUF1214 domain-containing protein [Bdellovibrio sp. NC01]QDK38721.1 DUF1254 domain-containing protein [Bdellovibrio sp. NC01]